MSMASVTAHSADLVPMSQALAAEFRRAKGSRAARFVWAGLAISVLQGLGWKFVATRPLLDWEALFGWQTIYATGLLAPIAGLLAAATVSREKTAREGGTWTRPLSPRTAMAARTCVMVCQVGLLSAALSLPLVPIGLAGGLSDPPIARILTLWFVFWGNSLLPLMAGFVLARWVGGLATAVLLLGFQIVGTVQAETASWWWQPWAWGVHATMPVLGIHANGTRLEAGAAAWEWSPVWPTLASFCLTSLIVGLLMTQAPFRRVDEQPSAIRGWLLWTSTFARPGGHFRSSSVRHSRMLAPGAGRISHVRAQLTLWRGTAVLPLIIVTFLVLIVVATVWNHDYVQGFTTWAVVPLGCCLLACLTEIAAAPGRRVVALRESPAQQAVVANGLGMGVLCIVIAFTSVLLLLTADASSTAAVETARYAVTQFCVGAMVLAVSAWLATRFSTELAIGCVLVLLIVSAVFGGEYFAQLPLWVIGVLGWPLRAITPERLAIALSASVVITGLAYVGHVRALRRSVR